MWTRRVCRQALSTQTVFVTKRTAELASEALQGNIGECQQVNQAFTEQLPPTVGGGSVADSRGGGKGGSEVGGGVGGGKRVSGQAKYPELM